jgi:ubiquinone/menaquinone biosynthesis C-methylase UbiE
MPYLFGRIYDALLEPMLHSWKSRLALWIDEASPGATLDICCGTGKQCRLIAAMQRAIGLDLDLSLLKYAKSVAPHIAFVCGDAAHLPFKPESFQNAGISLALHDKSPNLRTQMIREAQLILNRDGHFFLIDFEKPLSIKSRIGYALIYIIERMAGTEHFSNGREFVKSGGLEGFLQDHNLVTQKNHTSTWGSSSVVMTSKSI